MHGAVKLAELKGYITAKVDQYTEMANTCVKSISIDRVITDMENILDLIIDMQGQKEKIIGQSRYSRGRVKYLSC